MTLMRTGEDFIAAALSAPVDADKLSVVLPSLALLDEGIIDVRAPTETVLVLPITTTPPVDTALISRPPRVV